MDKKEYIDLLNNDPEFQKILQSAKDDKERRIAKYMSEQLLVSILGAVIPMTEEIKKNPEIFKNGLVEMETSILTEDLPGKVD